jgi:hypothetical protein
VRREGWRRIWSTAVCAVLAAPLLLPAGSAAFADQRAAQGAIDRAFIEDEAGPESSQARGRMIGLWFVRFDRQAFSIDSGAVSVKLSCMHFCRLGTTRVLRASDQGAVRVTYALSDRSTAFVSVPVPADVPWGIYRVELLDRERIARSSAGALEAVPELSESIASIPTSDKGFGGDVNLAAARRKYVGRTVQGFGDLAVDCDDLAVPPEQRRPMVVGNEPSLIVAKIDRPLGATLAWKIGGPVNNRWSTDDHFVAISPLRVSFERTSPPAFAGCRNPHLWLADAWEVGRMLWIHRPIHLSETEPIRLGMRKMEVAHILGLPAVFGTLAEAFRFDTWRYLPVLPPFDYAVSFRDGRVSAYRPAASLR